ncbi:MAG: RnfABCDGE type electron transport complex subunit C [Candidatus Omnitrophica bacterium]|nr:RnfABCDGE type electron transport complex subunit C [Candidatus Omnitrophota bacterium]
MAPSRLAGIRLERKKDASLLNWNLKKLFTPKQINIPLRRDTAPCVEVGERVIAGQKIGEPGSPDGATVHAGLTGTVSRLAPPASREGGERGFITIQKDPDPKQNPMTWEIRKDWERIPTEALCGIFKNSGLVTTEIAEEPIHAKVRKCLGTRTLIVNCCEPEPYVTCEQTLLLTHPLEVLKGAECLRKAFGAARLLFAFESCDREIGELLKSKIFFLKWDHTEVRPVPALYPQGTAALLSRNPSFLEKGARPAGVLPASTAFAAYEAVACQKPFYERIVTVGGECVVEPRSLWLPIGTTFRDALHACKGVMREPETVIMNGPMSGIAQTDLNVPVTAGTAAVLALPREIARRGAEEPCVRCNLCADHCPAGIAPGRVTLAADRGEFEQARLFGVMRCVECGNCGYVCPSQRPMLEKIRKAKKRVEMSLKEKQGAAHD